jgi:hypothetical protein
MRALYRQFRIRVPHGRPITVKNLVPVFCPTGFQIQQPGNGRKMVREIAGKSQGI